MSLSTIEAEYLAAMMAAQESTWLVQLLENLHQTVDYPVPLYYDNQSVICLVENLEFHARTKHVEVQYHFIHEKALTGEIKVIQVKTEEQLADIFTKGLNSEKLYEFRKELDMTLRRWIKDINNKGEY